MRLPRAEFFLWGNTTPTPARQNRAAACQILQQKLDERLISFQHPARIMTKDTAKALVIIIAALGVLVVLLLWANHLRPHGI